jgi:hypothetical protein
MPPSVPFYSWWMLYVGYYVVINYYFGVMLYNKDSISLSHSIEKPNTDLLDKKDKPSDRFRSEKHIENKNETE